MKLMKKSHLIYISVILPVLIFTIVLFSMPSTLQGNGDGEPDPSEKPTVPILDSKKNGGWVYGQIEFPYDVFAPNLYFMKLHDYPNESLGVPDVYGAYATTDVYVKVQLRGVSVPRGLQEKEKRARPPLYLERERERWAKAMQYVWNLMEPTKTFRLGNFEVLKENELIEADIEVQLGGAWMNLAVLMVNDHIVRANVENIDWDFGGYGVAPLNPGVPK